MLTQREVRYHGLGAAAEEIDLCERSVWAAEALLLVQRILFRGVIQARCVEPASRVSGDGGQVGEHFVPHMPRQTGAAAFRAENDML